MDRLEEITLNYWDVSVALKHPDSKAMTHEQAFKKLLIADKLRPEEWRLRELVHVIRYDLIEGHTKWRGKEHVTSLALILPMKP